MNAAASVAVSKPSASPWITPYDFGAVGDGIADDTVPYQQFLYAIQGGKPALAWGTFATSLPVRIFGGTTLTCAHTLKRLPGHTHDLLLNANFAPAGTPRIDKGITLLHVTLEGDDRLTETPNSLVTFIGVERLRVHFCLFANHRRSLLAISNCDNWNIDFNEFTGWGQALPYTGTAGQWWGGAAVHTTASNSNGSIVNNYFHDASSGAVWIEDELDLSRNVTIALNRFVNLFEWSVFGFNQGTVFLGNTMVNTGRADISGQNIESHRQGVVYVGNYHSTAAAANLYVTDPKDWVIAGNLFKLAAQLAGVDPSLGAITVRTADPRIGSGPTNVSIACNLIIPGAGQVGYAISHVNYSGNAKNLPVAVLEDGNNYGAAGGWKGLPVGG